MFDKVCCMIPLNFDAKIRVECGDEHFFASLYQVRSVTYDARVARTAAHDMQGARSPYRDFLHN
jgi:hypothetical protein